MPIEEDEKDEGASLFASSFCRELCRVFYLLTVAAASTAAIATETDAAIATHADSTAATGVGTIGVEPGDDVPPHRRTETTPEEGEPQPLVSVDSTLEQVLKSKVATQLLSDSCGTQLNLHSRQQQQQQQRKSCRFQLLSTLSWSPWSDSTFRFYPEQVSGGGPE